MVVFLLLFAVFVLSVVVDAPARAQGEKQLMREYSRRMEALFVQLDVDRNGRLERHELKGHRALKRRLHRQARRDYLVLDDVRGNPGQLRARRLSRRYQLADANADNRLSKGEAAAMPWVARHFEFLDRNRDGLVSWRELLDLQRSLTPDQRRP